MEHQASRRTQSARGHRVGELRELGLMPMDETPNLNQATMSLNPELTLGLTLMDETHRLNLLDDLKRQWEEVS